MPPSKYPFADRATKYAKQIVAGKAKACRYIRIACQRHIDDLKRKDLAWDREAADRVCKFAGLMVHVKGEWAGKRIVLEDWQCFILACLFGWKRKSDGLRKYSEAYLEIARKNSKSTLAAIVGLYMLTIDGEPGAEVYSGATSEKQALEVFRPAWQMVRGNQELKSHYGINLGGTATNPGTISTIENASRFEAVVHKPGDGASPHCGIVDEYHEHKTPDLRDTFSTGMGARRQPLLLTTTTAGTNTSAPCFALRKRCVDMLEKTINDDSLFALIYTIDEDSDWQDFGVWAMANPNMGVSVYEHYLRKRYEKALNNPGERNIILCKHLNVWNNAGVSAFDMAAWSKCENRNLDIDDFIQGSVCAGVDLASKVDIASLVILGPLHNGKLGIMARHYLPKLTVQKPENAHYQQWEADGYLTVTAGASTDFGEIESDIQAADDMCKIKRLGFDPREATYLLQCVKVWAGFDLVEINQSPAQMSEPMKELEALIIDGKIEHDGDPILTWMFSNVQKKQAKGGGPVKYYYPTKLADELKIDGAVAAIMALKMYMAEDGPSLISPYADPQKEMLVI